MNAALENSLIIIKGIIAIVLVTVACLICLIPIVCVGALLSCFTVAKWLHI